jgi:8-oxo-dGTP pyrophosphatase MutT (NUDIX family)
MTQSDGSRAPWAVVGLIFEKGDHPRVLTIGRRNKPDNIGLIGGKIDGNETPEAALVREIFEETSLIVRREDINWVYQRIDYIVQAAVWYGIVGHWEGTPRSVDPEQQVQWATLNELLRPSNTFSRYNSELMVMLSNSVWAGEDPTA